MADSKDSKTAKEPEQGPLYKITLLSGARLSVHVAPEMNIGAIEDFGQGSGRNKDGERIVGNLEKTGERVVIRWEAVAFIEEPPKVEKRAGF